MIQATTQPEHSNTVKVGGVAAVDAAGNTETIARNTAWYGFEVAFGLVTAFATSIAVARVMGPQKLGYYSYVLWLVNSGANLASVGLPATARKYMAEYLGRGEPGVARSIFFATLRLQSIFAAAITLAGMVLVFTVSEPAFRASSAFLVASTFPLMLTMVLAQANTAAENMAANVPGSLLSSCLYIAGVVLSLTYGWGLPGIAAGFCFGRSAELLVRLWSVLRWIRDLPSAPLPQAVRSRMLNFSGLSTVLMVVQLVVWDRSDIVLLKSLGPSIGEVTFFSIAFNLTEKFLLMPQAFAQAIGASVMAQFGRDPSALGKTISNAARYMLLCGLPIMLCLALLSGPLVEVLYGHQFLRVIPVLVCAALLAIPKSVLLPAMQLMQAAEQQKFLLLWISLSGVVNVAIDLLLIPAHGAMGAALGNGLGQAFAVAGIWVRVAQLFRLDLRQMGLGRILAAGLVTALPVLLSVQYLHGWAALVAGTLGACTLFVLMLRTFHVLGPQDTQRLLRVSKRVPPPFRKVANQLVFVMFAAK